jgi:hypothetical protein
MGKCNAVLDGKMRPSHCFNLIKNAEKKDNDKKKHSGAGYCNTYSKQSSFHFQLNKTN